MSKKTSDTRKLKNVLQKIERDVKTAFEILERIQGSSKTDHSDILGVSGVFDGECMVTKEGEKHTVPANYAAKSRLVCGDELKMIEVDGKTLFKHLVKVPRKKIEGVLNKKEGKWYVLTEVGTYKVLDTAADFNNAQLNEKAIVIIPEGNSNVPFAALEKILRVESDIPNVSNPAPQVEKIAEPAEELPSKNSEIDVKSVKPKASEQKAKPVAKAKNPIVKKAAIEPKPETKELKPTPLEVNTFDDDDLR